MLQIIFKDGETRKVNLLPAFFLDAKGKKESPGEIEKKCFAIAHDFGGTIYKLILWKDGVETILKENHSFSPEENTVLKVVATADEKFEKRAYRRMFKNSVFTTKYSLTSGALRIGGQNFATMQVLEEAV